MKRPIARLATGLPAATVLAAAAVTLGSPAAHAASGVEIRTFANKCLDVEWKSADNGARIVQHRCHREYNQRFRFVPAGHGRVEIRTFANKCLDVHRASPDNGARIIQYTCTGDANQRFRVLPAPGGRHSIRTFVFDKCLDVNEKSARDGARIIQYSCTGDYNQRFEFRNR
ncbi:RICIN domain-containing protein [Actinomadura harenae]|nr:RICIN domain-containing protein [Actinomadura harenae]